MVSSLDGDVVETGLESEVNPSRERGERRKRKLSEMKESEEGGTRLRGLHSSDYSPLYIGILRVV